MEFSAQQIADILKGTVDGNPEVKVSNFSKIEEGKPGTLTFLANPKYEHYIYGTKASLVLVNNEFKPTEPVTATLVRVENAYASLAILLNMVEQMKTKKCGIDSTAYISSSATIGKDCYIGAFAYIGDNTHIGDNCLIYPQAYIGDGVKLGNSCIIYPHATIYHDCVLNNRCTLHAGVVIGGDGFGFAPEGESYKKIPQLGNVILEDDVEIGANTCIDRAVMESTIIHKGVKLDNLIQIAHNVEIGENSVFAAQVGIAGSTKVGSHCMFGGQVGLAGHIHLADRVNLGAQSGVAGSLKTGNYQGTPAIELRQWMRSSILFSKIGELNQTINQLKKEVDQLKNELNNK